MENLRSRVGDADLLEKATQQALEYIESIDERPVFPSSEALSDLEAFEESLPRHPSKPEQILDELNEVGSPATVAQTGRRYYGFVNGGLLPAPLAAKWLASAWDQNAGLHVISPIASTLERVCEKWLVDLFGLPTDTAAGFVTGTSAATLCGIAAGRNTLLRELGWPPEEKGMFGAPCLRVVTGDQAHSSVYKALSLLGFGTEEVVTVPTDEEGRILPEKMPELDRRTLLVLQAGNVNSGSFDPFSVLCRRAREAGAWTHVDGAFGLWAAASDEHAHLTMGVEQADSWAVDGHKTLNAPYDNGVILCRSREALTRALDMSASYITYSEERDGFRYTPDMSRRAQGVEMWATLKALGQDGVSALVDGLGEKASDFAKRLSAHGFTIENEVSFNQVLVRCDSASVTSRTLENIQDSGVCWCGGTTWQGEPVIRISVCSYRTTHEDINRSVKTFRKARVQARKEESGK